MALGFISQTSIGEVIKIVGLFRNQTNFAFFMLEESFQTLNLAGSAMYKNGDYRESYSVSTYAIQELVGWIKLAELPGVSQAIYPMNLAYIAFFRAELDAFLDLRDKSITRISTGANETGVFSQALVNALKAKGTNSRKYYIDSTGTIASLTDAGVWDNSSLWETKST